MQESFKGIFPPLATPFVDDKISPEKFKENIQKYNSLDLAGYVILGTSGESPLLSALINQKCQCLSIIILGSWESLWTQSCSSSYPSILI